MSFKDPCNVTFNSSFRFEKLYIFHKEFSHNLFRIIFLLRNSEKILPKRIIKNYLLIILLSVRNKDSEKTMIKSYRFLDEPFGSKRAYK